MNKWDDLGGNTPIFGGPPIYNLGRQNVSATGEFSGSQARCSSQEHTCCKHRPTKTGQPGDATATMSSKQQLDLEAVKQIAETNSLLYYNLIKIYYYYRPL